MSNTQSGTATGNQPTQTDVWGTAAGILGVAIAAECPWTEFFIGEDVAFFGLMLVEYDVEEHGFQNPTGTEERVDVMGDGVFLEYVLVEEGIIAEEVPVNHDVWLG